MTRDRSPGWLPAVARIAAGLIAMLGRTWRIEHPDGFTEQDVRIQGGEPCIYAFWHGRMLPLVYYYRARGVGVLVSRHRDGEWIARAIEALGFRTARGSSTRGGEAGLREMLAHADLGRSLAITPDGPRGPARQVKPGLVYLASRSGLPIVPVTSASNWARVLGSWDGFRIPIPFARVRIATGEPLRVPTDLAEADVEPWRLRVEQAIEQVSARAGRDVGEPA